MLWLYREHDVIWNEFCQFLIEGWQHGPNIGPRMMALTKKKREMVLIGCAMSRPRSRGYHISKHGKCITTIQYFIAILSVNVSPDSGH